MTTDQQIQAGYDQKWAAGKNDLLRSDIDVDSIPDSTSKRWGISAVLRLSSSQSDSVLKLIGQLREFTGEGCTFYDPITLHVTLRSIKYFRERIESDDEHVATYTKLLNRLAPSFPELAVAFKGLSANRVGIILQGFPITDALQRLRWAFHQALAQEHLLAGPERQQPRLNAHASLVVYGASTLTTTKSLVDFVEDRRATYYGQLTTAQIDLVRYERQLDSVNLVILDQIVLGKR